jgi:hypothetical protein
MFLSYGDRFGEQTFVTSDGVMVSQEINFNEAENGFTITYREGGLEVSLSSLWHAPQSNNTQHVSLAYGGETEQFTFTGNESQTAFDNKIRGFNELAGQAIADGLGSGFARMYDFLAAVYDSAPAETLDIVAEPLDALLDLVGVAAPPGPPDPRCWIPDYCGLKANCQAQGNTEQYCILAVWDANRWE